jgi:proline iminopeptidase
MRTFYPPLDAYDSGLLPVSPLHTLFYEQAGNPKGKPVVFLHGGPGGGVAPDYRRFFDPQKYRIVLFDQRGCGKSTPHAELTDNTTWDLVADIERLRVHLGIERWQVFGGSWGSTLALAYAQTHPERVTELVLRGIFLCRQSELRWYYQEGASHIFPDRFEPYRDFIPAAERHDLMTAYHKRLTGSDHALRLEAARQWTKWEMTTSKLITPEEDVTKDEDAAFALAFARIENHYFMNGIFMPDGALLDPQNIAKIRHIPCVIVHGRYDVVCPVKSAWELHKAWPESVLNIIPDAGHASTQPGILSALVEATDAFADRPY